MEFWPAGPRASEQEAAGDNQSLEELEQEDTNEDGGQEEPEEARPASTGRRRKALSRIEVGYKNAQNGHFVFVAHVFLRFTTEKLSLLCSAERS